MAIAGFHRAAQGALQRFTVYPVQLLGNQTDGHQARVVMALGDDKNIILNVFIDHVPWIFATLFGAADTQPFTLAQGVVHQLMSTDLLAVDGEDFAGCAGR